MAEQLHNASSTQVQYGVFRGMIDFDAAQCQTNQGPQHEENLR